jgi:L-amino acid N-acyltransferase
VERDPRPWRPPPGLRLRPAALGDAEAIRSIYNDAVRTTTATFDTEPRGPVAQRRWMAAHAPPYSVLVAERDGRVVGWASLSAWSDRRAYDATAEVSEYVAAAERGHGIGRAMLGRLLRDADRRGFHSMIARIADGNRASLRLHRAFGFRRIGVMREVGLKFGRRIDVHLLQRMAPGRDGPPPGSPAPSLPGNRLL